MTAGRVSGGVPAAASRVRYHFTGRHDTTDEIVVFMLLLSFRLLIIRNI